MSEMLESTWLSRDYPVLVSVARSVEGAIGKSLMESQLERPDGCDVDEFRKALLALNSGEYLDVEYSPEIGGSATFRVRGLPERGRRAVGLWPPN